MSDDRYPPNPLHPGAGMAEELRELRRRLTALEGARDSRNARIAAGGRMRFSSGGSIVLENDQGRPATALGENVSPARDHAAFGLLIQERFSGDYDGQDVMLVTDHGWGKPEWAVALVGPWATVSTSSTSYETGWLQAGRILGQHLFLSMRLLPPVGQTISYRVQMSLDDGATLIDVYERTGIASPTSDGGAHPMPDGFKVGMWASLFIDIKVSGGTGSAYPRFGPYWQVRESTYEGTPSTT